MDPALAPDKPSAVVQSSSVVYDQDAEPSDHQQPKQSRSRRLRRLLWDSLDKSPEERAFVNKADWWIMSYVCVAYFVKYLDQTNGQYGSVKSAKDQAHVFLSVTNAYVSGMKEDIGMSGQDYNLLQTMFTAGYVIGNLASQLVMLKVRPSIWLPSLEFAWSILVMAMAAAKKLETLLILRFFIGLLEASAFPGVLTLLGNWYKAEELGKRSSIFIATSAAGSMFSGYLQAGLYRGMNGKHGIAAWRWLMIFDGIIGIPVSLYGFFAVPDSPTNTRALWLKPRDGEMGMRRMEGLFMWPM
ncbi:hypothetical protein AC578_9187 [Pseudocercospora eumusae]|uniref:Major facilitator superfamily (MFS) profile domain-containing protein n=1 Tax=Pseudocercospora eumusae TaxID=321146 RepID=A0A139HUV9_9PEZI|nr:hypothetical protein AC578_9187 [Pseudocercospora eumusae]